MAEEGKKIAHESRQQQRLKEEGKAQAGGQKRERRERRREPPWREQRVQCVLKTVEQFRNGGGGAFQKAPGVKKGFKSHS